MRLWYLTDARLPGEAANTVQVMKMSAAFAAAGAEVRLLARPARGAGDELFRFYAVPRMFDVASVPRLIPGRSRRDRWSVPFALSAVAWLWWRRRSFDLAYTRHPLLASLATAAGLPVAYEAHRLLPTDDASDLRRGATFGARARRSNFKAMVGISAVLAEWYVARGFPAESLIVEHDGVDLERFTPPSTKDAARTRCGLPQDRPIIGYAGHLYRGRGIEDLLACAAKMPEALFLFAGGSAGDVERLKREAERLGVENVRFTSFIPNGELAPWLFAPDVLAMPYNKETGSALFMSPMKMFEYMAAERTIVATRWPSVEEILKDGENAVLVASDDRDALLVGLRRGLAEAASGALAAAARRDVERHTWRSRADRILRFIAARSGVAAKD